MTDGGKFIKIMSEQKLTFEKVCDPAFRRAEQLKTKSGAVWVAFLELGGLINISRLSREYFSRSHGWFSQKLHGNNVCDKERAFTPEEYGKLAEAFRDIARRLDQYADCIDSASDRDDINSES